MDKKNYNNFFVDFIKQKQYKVFDITNFKEKNSVNTSKNHSIELEGLRIIGEKINGVEFIDIDFNECTFSKTQFSNIRFSASSFVKCKFINCDFRYIIFAACQFIDCSFDGIFMTSSKFIHAFMSKVLIRSNNHKAITNIDYTDFEMSQLTDVLFDRIRITRSQFSNLNVSLDNKLVFKNCMIENNKFYKLSFVGIAIESEYFSENTIVACSLPKNTLKTVDKEIYLNQNSSFIDMQSIVHSDISEDEFSLFGIHGFDPKGYVQDLVTRMTFQSIFISYSFKDKIFANAICYNLTLKGIRVWFWERDAPGGKRLKQIMRDNIQSHDRLLFIASEHSLKSEACHYELQEAREKQNKEWKDIYYPIHIDNYLFEVRKEDIPRKYREDFWENIEEVKEFNSKDYTQFKTEEDFKSPEFEEAVKQLIKDLKL